MNTNRKFIVGYVIASILLFLIIMIPTFFGFYNLGTAVFITIGAVLADLVGLWIKRKLKKRRQKSNSY